MPISCCAIPSTAACKSRRTDARKIPGLRYDRKARCPPFPREPLWAKIQVSWSAKRKARQASASPLNGRPQSPSGDDDEASYSVLRHTSRQEPIPSPRVELWRCPRPIGALHDVERPFFEFAQISTSPQIATSARAFVTCILGKLSSSASSSGLIWFSCALLRSVTPLVAVGLLYTSLTSIRRVHFAIR